MDLFEILQAEDAPKLVSHQHMLIEGQLPVITRVVHPMAQGAEQMRRLFTAMTGKDTSFAQAKYCR